MKYQIFTDESGHWGNEDITNGEYYVRCWIRAPINESFDDESACNFKIYFTFSSLPEFRNRKFLIKDSIKQKVETAFVELEEAIKGKDYMKKIPKVVEGAINKVLFLHLYERYAWEDAKIAGMFDGVEKYFIHSPQFTKMDYYDLLKIIGIEKNNISFIKNDDNKGVNLADKYAGKFCKILNNSFSNTSEVHEFKSFLATRFVSEGKIMNGIDKIFWNPKLPVDRDTKSMIRKHLTQSQ